MFWKQKTEFNNVTNEQIKQAIDLFFMNSRLDAIKIINKLIEQESVQNNLNNNTNLSYLYGLKGYIHECEQQKNESIEAYQRAYELCPIDDKINRLIFQSSIFIQTDKTQDALKCLEEVLSMNPKNTYALYQKAFQKYISKDLDEAAQIMSQALEVEPKNEFLTQFMGIISSASQKYDESNSFYDKTIEIRQNYFKAYYNKGLNLDELKRYQDAVDEYDKAIRINPKQFGLVAYNKAFSLKNMGKNKEAVEIFDELIKIDPNDSYYYSGKIQCLEILKEHQKVIDCCQIYMKLFPEESFGYRICAKNYDFLDQYENLIQVSDKWIKAIPNEFNAYEYKILGLDYIKAEKSKSLEVYQAYLQLNPNHQQSLALICDIFLNQQDKQEELLVYSERLIKQHPSFANAYFYKGFALGNLEKYEEALIQLDKSIQLKPESYLPYEYKAKFLKNQKMYKEALESVNKSLQLNENSAFSYAIKGSILYELKEYKEANAAFDKNIALNPNNKNWGILYMKVYCLKEINMMEEALQTLKEAQKIEPNRNFYKDFISILNTQQKYVEIDELLDKAVLKKQEQQQNSQNQNNSNDDNDQGLDWMYFIKGQNYQKMKKQKEALECYIKCIDLSQDQKRVFEAAVLKAEIQDNQQGYEELLKACDSIIRLNQNLAEAYKQQGLAYKKLNKLSEAYNSFQAALLKNSDWINEFEDVTYSLNKYQDYLEVLKQVFENKLKSWIDAGFKLCYYYRDQSWDEVQAFYYTNELEKKYLSEIDEMNGSETKNNEAKIQFEVFNYEKAVLLKKSGKTKEAIEKLNEIAQKGNKKLYESALLLQEMNKFSDALICINKYYQLHPQDEKGIQLQKQLLQQVKAQTEQTQQLTEKIKKETQLIEEMQQKQQKQKNEKNSLEFLKQQIQFDHLNIAISLQLVKAELSVVDLKVEEIKKKHMTSILNNIKTKQKEINQKCEEVKKSGSEITHEFLKQNYDILLQFQFQLNEMQKDISDIQSNQKKQDDALINGGVYDQSNAKIALDNLEKDNPEFLVYYKTLYWTLLNYFQAYRVANTDVLQHNQNSNIETQEKLGKQAIQGALSIAKPIPVIGGFVGMINSVIDSVFSMIQEKRFLDKKTAINKIVISKFNTETELNLKIMQAAISITQLKKQQILNIDKEVEKKNNQQTTMDKIKNLISTQITNLKVYLSLLSPQEQQSPTCQLALNDAALLLLFMFKNSDSMVSNSDTLDIQLSEVISTNLIQTQFNQYSYYEIDQKKIDEEQNKAQNVDVVKTSSCCNVF